MRDDKVLKNILIYTATAATMFLTGCASTPTESDAGPYPAKYKDITRDYLKTSLFDPYTARDFQISTPKIGEIHLIGTMSQASGWLVCYRGNAKNRMGAYTGIKVSGLLIKNDRAVGTNDSDYYLIRKSCDDAQYEPFSLS